jgi:hypothetical protein
MALLGLCHFANGQDVTYGFVQGANPLQITAVAYPDFNSSNTTMVTSVFSFLLPAGTVTDPSVMPAPATNQTFVNITGDWNPQLVNAANYMAQGGNPADLMGNDIYQVVLQNSPVLNNIQDGTPIELFSFTLPSDCIGGNVEVLTNGGSIQQAILNNLFSNFNNQMSLSVGGGAIQEAYAGNDPSSFSIPCPLSMVNVPDAVDDNYTVPVDLTTSLTPLVNDDFGGDGPSTGTISIVTPPTNGTAVVNDNGTPNDPTDDTIEYTPSQGYSGPDNLVYGICDATGDCDQATISLIVTSSGPCAPDGTAPTLTVSDASATTPQATQSLTPPEGACSVERTWQVGAFDACGQPTVTSSITNNNLGVFPSAELVQLNGLGTFALEIQAAIGTNTITVTAMDASGNATTQTFVIIVNDVRLPEIYGPGDMNVEIPSCEEDIPVNWTVTTVDDCDIQPSLVQTAGPASGTSLAPGTYTVAYESTDDSGNTATYSFDINVTQAPSPAAIIDISGNGQFTALACEDEAFVIFSGNVYDCDIEAGDNVTITVDDGDPTTTYNLFTESFDGFAYFEATADLPPGSYLIEVTYGGTTVNHFVDVVQNADQPATITMPGNQSFIAGACQPGADLSFQVQITDDCDTDLSGATFTLNGDPAPAIDAAASNPAAGVYVWNLPGIPAGLYTLGATYTDGNGNISTAETTFTVSDQPDNWAPIVIYPSQNINVELDPCEPSTAVVSFEVTATDNCDGDVTPSVSVSPLTGVQGTIIEPSAGGDTYVFTAAPGSYLIEIEATDAAGNTRNEDFRINITQDPQPAAALACNDLINVTLDEDCQRTVTADMVLEGSFGCYGEDDFTVTIFGGTETYGNVLPDHGQFFYEVTLNTLQPIVGFTAELAPSNWTVVEENGSSVSIDATSATLVSSNAGGCTDAEGSMSAAVPFAGTLSFDYDYSTGDPGFEGYIVQVDASGNVTTLVDIDASAAGTVTTDVEAGDVIYIAVISADCILGPGTAEITNFSLDPSSANTAPLDFEPCWGEINAEDKDGPAIECLDNTGTGTIVKNGFSIIGELDVDDPQVIVNNYSCLIDNTQPDFPGTRYVDAQEFQVSEDDVYTFFVASDVTDLGNVGFAIYQGSFDPENPCENIIAQSDIPQPPGGGNPLPGSQPNDPYIRLALPLIANETYIIVTTSFLPDATGAYEYSVCADDEGQVGMGEVVIVTNPDWTMDTVFNFVPFPITTVTVEVPLVCGDEERLVVTTLDPGVPRCYETDSDGNVILPSNQVERDLLLQLFERLDPGGFPGILEGVPGGGTITDNCVNLTVCVSDEVISNGDCGGKVIVRTFVATDEKGMQTVCSQTLTLSNVSVDDIWLPPFTAPVECDENFPTLPNGNPSPAITGFPFLYTGGGIIDLDEDYCNLGATYEDGPTIDVCEGTYKFIRTWTILDWCAPTDFFTYPQIIKVGDFTAPTVTCPDGSNNYGLAAQLPYAAYSTSAYSCTATFQAPMPEVTDNCSGFSVFTEIVTEAEVNVTNQWGQVVGTELDTVLVATIPAGANRLVSGIPIGQHFFRYTVADDCGNVTVVYCPFEVVDLVQPVAICDDQLNISLGGGFSYAGDPQGEVRARVYAEDFDEGSWDNCEIASLEVRRNKFNFFGYTCGTGFGVTNPILFDGWGPYVDFLCCDVGVEIEIELRVTDVYGNQNICWLTVTPEDKTAPYCIAPPPASIDCDDLPYGFDPTDLDELQDLFGFASSEDNCDATVEELPAITSQLDECGFGRIIRRFRAVDSYGTQSTNVCQQIIDINEVHNYEIKFPMDESLVCNEVPDTAELEINELGCDLIAVSQEDHVFTASADECYKIFRTYKVINWCQYDGESDPVVITRDSDCFDGPGNNMFWLLARPNGYVYLDADNDETPGNNVPGLNFCNFQIRDFYQKFQDDTGYYQYTQHIRVYDDVAPEVIFEEPTDPFCSFDGVDCDALVTYDFSVSDNCTPDDLDVRIFLDAFADGFVDGELTGSLGASFEFTVSGTYPDYTISGVFPLGTHTFIIEVRDGCGNIGGADVDFTVIDCKAPAPICINGISLELMPADTDGDNIPDGGMAEIWATDYLASPISDCTGPIKYSINFAGQPNDPNQDVLFFTCADTGTQVVEIWAYDGLGNGDFCETYVIVQDNMGVCGSPDPGTMAGAVNTEDDEAVSDVQVSLSGQMSASATTGTDGAYSFTNLQPGLDYTVTPQRDGDYLNGVSTFDLVLISKHILGLEPLDSPYKMIAADVNNSGNISTLDLIQLRKLILSIDTEFANNTSWRFVEADYVFPSPSNPWLEAFPEVINQNNLPEAGIFDADFVAVKIGDIDGSVQANSLAAVENRSFEGTFAFTVTDTELKAGNEYTVEFTAADLARIEGYQATLALNSAVEVVDIIAGAAGEEHFGMVYADKGLITTSWNGDASSELAFSLILRATQDVQLSEAMSISSELTTAEAYGKDGSFQDVAIEFTNGQVAGTSFELYQNQPNPFKGETLIGFNLPEAADATITISDITGKVLTIMHLDGVKGYNSVLVDAKDLPATGVLSYTVKTGEYTATKKMIVSK